MARLLEKSTVLFAPPSWERLVYRLLGGQGVPADHQVQFVTRFRYERHHKAAVEVPRSDVVHLKGQGGPSESLVRSSNRSQTQRSPSGRRHCLKDIRSCTCTDKSIPALGKP